MELVHELETTVECLDQSIILHDHFDSCTQLELVKRYSVDHGVT